MKRYMDAISVQFDKLHWPSLHQPHLTLDDICPVIKTLSTDPAVDVTLLGHSYNGRPIHKISMGQGDIRIMGWTQMHGDEPTATAAVLDWFTLMAQKHDDIAPANLFKRCKLCFIVMLNPDGAQQKIRRNAQGIDINRDARVLQSPEGALLMQQIRRFAPHVAFNLHDQNPYYLAGNKQMRPSTLAFFAPPFDTERTTDSNRERAKQLIASIHHMLTDYTDAATARYVDAYSARCFGDTVAGMCSTILIESGARYNDPCRHTARKMNVLALHYAALVMATGASLPSASDYYNIPKNVEDGLCDLLLKHVKMGLPQQPYFVDISINDESGGARITDIGDLSNKAGFTEKACDSWRLLPDNPYRVTHPLVLTEARYRALLQQGYNRFVDSERLLSGDTSLPVVVSQTLNTCHIHPANVGHRPALLFTQHQEPGLAVIDCTVITL